MKQSDKTLILKDVEYEKRLGELNLDSLSLKVDKEEIILFFKILIGF